MHQFIVSKLEIEARKGFYCKINKKYNP